MNKNIQDKLFQELRHVIPSKDSQIDFDIINELPYLDQVLNESLRLLPTVPFATRKTNAEVELEEYTIPKGELEPTQNLIFKENKFIKFQESIL